MIRKLFAVTGISGSKDHPINDIILKEAKEKAMKALEAEFGTLEDGDEDPFGEKASSGVVEDENEDVDID